MSASLTRPARSGTWPTRLLALVQAAFGLALLTGGALLATLGGSWMYVLVGTGYCAGAWFLWRNSLHAAWVSLATFVLVLIWSLAEAGFHYWPQIPRLVLPAVLAMLVLIVTPLSLARTRTARRLSWPAAAGFFVALLGALAAAFEPHGVLEPTAKPRSASPGLTRSSDWTHYGHDASGTRHAPFDQITPANVHRLKVAWTYRSGDTGPGEDQNVPLQIGDTLYTCSRNDHIAALDADTGRERWTFDPKATSPFWQRCRGLGYHADASAQAAGEARAHCARRLFNTTNDARLIAIDADDGTVCESFGTHGTVDLLKGLGEVKPGFYLPTSAPLVARNRVIVGGFIADNQEVGEPSGVVRAYDVSSGELVWAWDLGNPDITKEPPPGQTYTRGTPNMWTTASADETLGLVYLPLGNATPDYYGVLRTRESEAFSSSIVALDLDTGTLRWKVQTVHHDLWDYDLPSQPSLIDLPDGSGGTIPALLQPTKRGQLFLLDRRTGQALAQIAEQPVPQSGHVPEEWLSGTQPYSVGMPSIGTEPLSEARMWGATPLDQLWCRIRFRQLRYEGEFTPPGLVGSIQYPGNFGGMNWGSASIDPVNGYAYVNDTRMPILVQLMPPEEARAMLAKLGGLSAHGPAMQSGTPYGVSVGPMLSPLGVPCNEPPFGTLSAIDLQTRRIVWQTPLGTVEDTGPLGIVSHLKMPVGMPTIGGTMTTAGGLVFFAGSQDFYIRAFDAADGQEVWKARMPVGSGSTPMSYVSPATGRQYVLISSGGTRQSPVRGDYVIAYALDGSP
ncbi:MAG: membrane-bound PQQ-dependent dehydrogenase, glucose/quinate/shikimate family [Rhodanobacter denitrificans]|uniref:Membrane-bound PQQ-dependent dehydrogenase, glucose/quinate/shikimate family n=1 Tax=Rhodanobacter denitrificans TaxID=666685 RepID=A0A2W5KRZ7_9GAMM|nr:MAG: membrane-bound PQQ-dependent dehydrogenase, glucose/quinate/shikimate family [Rhodanobacter denitrificans]